MGVRTALRWMLACAWLMAAGALQAQTIESVLAPGPVVQGHAKTEHDCNACHLRFDRAAQDRLCIVCHKEVGQDIQQHTGLHGRRDSQPACRSCHAEHRGRDAQLAAFDQKTFDHRVTEFELHDKHEGVACARCHLPGKKWREAPLTCVGCHTKDDVHKGSLGRKCEDCHTVKTWREAKFDHSKTHFPLLGKHADAKCEACHVDRQYKDTPRTCIGCHRKNDEHKGQYGERCETCHGVKAWKPSTFNHDVDTKYLLKDKHRAVKCAACHTGPIYVHKLGSACVDCHLKDDKHKTTLGRQCDDCHAERGWKDAKGFDHAKSRFPLHGAHVKVECKSCHVDALYRQTPGRCIDCHRKDDRHKGNLGEGCGDCHGDVTWRGTQGSRFDHQRTRFPLRNAHGAPSLKCQDCHETQRDFRGTPTACVSCHRRDDRHEGTLGARCEQCHTDLTWRVARLDHSLTRFPLLGGHALVACASCHVTLRYKDTPRDCAGCHAKDDTHKATLGKTCAGCHNVRAWALWEFDHTRNTRYKLVGRHLQVRCAACHALPAPADKPIAAVGSDCLACHRKDDTHEGHFGRRCEQCHVPERWRQVRQSTGAR
jgi:hypothetical protein